jgi:hypothetical protein
MTRYQKQRRGKLEQTQQGSLFLPPNSTFLLSSNRAAEMTKQTGHLLSGDRKRESSPQGGAASPSPELLESRGETLLAAPDEREEGEEFLDYDALMAAAKTVFTPTPKLTRKAIYSYDVHGRYSQVDTGKMGDEAFHRLLEAAKNSLTGDDDHRGNIAKPTPVSEIPLSEIPEGCKIGPATGLAIPDWWETELGDTPEEKLATIRRNLEKAKQLGKGNLFKPSPGAGRRFG